ncbi:unnamed protein product [Adineta steineri]|uniref:G-protein coupled receptors family 1 profile domain-containing protein n=1 Tax=Adineta steineri TaxID=433720 RepID=A0A815C4K8_9BILA|nr:unnamed protein product [Adineta steineri]
MASDLKYTLSILTLNLNRIVPILQIILGTFGNVINILIFSRRSLRKNPCSIYFLALSINNIFALYVALLTRLLSSGWQIDPSNTNNILCKLRIFFSYVSLCLTQWFIVLASIDRFLSSCRTVRYRQFSNKSITRKGTIFIIIFIALIHFHVLIWFQSAPIGRTLTCNIFDKNYQLFFTIFTLVFTSLLPPFFMIIFGLQTIFNVRKLRRQVAPQTNNTRTDRLRSKDRQMIRMLLFQVLLTIICTTPFTTINLYTTIGTNIILSSTGTIIYNFCANVFRLLNYCIPVIGFYIYTLASRTFRSEIKHILREFIKRIGLVQCLPENAQTLVNEQSGSLASGGNTFSRRKTGNHRSTNQTSKYL